MRENLFDNLKNAEDRIINLESGDKNINPYTLTRPAVIKGQIFMISELINLSTTIKRIGLRTIDPDYPQE